MDTYSYDGLVYWFLKIDVYVNSVDILLDRVGGYLPIVTYV